KKIAPPRALVQRRIQNKGHERRSCVRSIGGLPEFVQLFFVRCSISRYFSRSHVLCAAFISRSAPPRPRNGSRVSRARHSYDCFTALCMAANAVPEEAARR